MALRFRGQEKTAIHNAVTAPSPITPALGTLTSAPRFRQEAASSSLRDECLADLTCGEETSAARAKALERCRRWQKAAAACAALGVGAVYESFNDGFMAYGPYESHVVPLMLSVGISVPPICFLLRLCSVTLPLRAAIDLDSRRRARGLRGAAALQGDDAELAVAAAATVTGGKRALSAARETLPAILARVSKDSWESASPAALRSIGRLATCGEPALAEAALRSLLLADGRIEAAVAIKSAARGARHKSIRVRAAAAFAALMAGQGPGASAFEERVEAQRIGERIDAAREQTGVRALFARTRLLREIEAFGDAGSITGAAGLVADLLRNTFRRDPAIEQIGKSLSGISALVVTAVSAPGIAEGYKYGYGVPFNLFLVLVFLGLVFLAGAVSHTLLVGVPLMCLRPMYGRQRAAAARISARLNRPPVEVIAALATAARDRGRLARRAASGLPERIAAVAAEDWRSAEPGPVAAIGEILTGGLTVPAAVINALALMGDRLELLPAYNAARLRGETEAVRSDAARKCAALAPLAAVRADAPDQGLAAAVRAAESVPSLESPGWPGYLWAIRLGEAAHQVAQTDLAETRPAVRGTFRRTLYLSFRANPALRDAVRVMRRSRRDALLGIVGVSTLAAFGASRLNVAYQRFGRELFNTIAGLTGAGVGAYVLAAVLGESFIETAYLDQRVQAATALGRLRQPDEQSAGALATAARAGGKAALVAVEALPRVLGVVPLVEWTGASDEALKAVGRLLSSRNIAVAEAAFSALEEVDDRTELIGAYDRARYRARTAALRVRAGARYQALRVLETGSLLRTVETPAGENLLVPAYASAPVDPRMAVRASGGPELMETLKLQ